MGHMGYCHIFFQWHVRAILMNQTNRDVTGMMWMSLKKLGHPTVPRCNIIVTLKLTFWKQPHFSETHLSFSFLKWKKVGVNWGLQLFHLQVTSL